MSLTAVTGIHIAWIDGDAVILDVANDAYSCLISADRGRTLSDPAADVVAALLKQGVIREIPGTVSALRPMLRTTWHDLPAMSGTSLPVPVILIFMITFLETSLQFLSCSLARLTTADRGNNAPPAGDPIAIANTVEQFERLAVFMPFRPACLFRSLFLRRFLARCGHATSWVFGVHLFPFRAHCWLAVGDAVVGDAAHRVIAYETILTVDRV